MSDTITPVTKEPTARGMNMRGLLISIVLNAAIPFGFYVLCKRFISPNEIVALSIAALFPAILSMIDFMRDRRFDLIGILVLLGIVYTLPAAFVLAFSPMLLGGLTIVTILWTFAYVRRANRRGAEALRRKQEAEVAHVTATGMQA